MDRSYHANTPKTKLDTTIATNTLGRRAFLSRAVNVAVG
jgi:hypothetical protein